MARYKVKVFSSREVGKKGEEKKLEGKVTTLLFDVNILEERSTYGRQDYLIEPVSGKGKAWVRNIKK